MPTVAVVLSGCGAYDGTDTHEASAVCEALTRAGMEVVFYAPDKPLYQVVNHVTGKVTDASDRNVLIESARVAKKRVWPLTNLTVNDAEAIVFPGGFGAAKNLCTFGTSSDDLDPDVDADVKRVLEEFNDAKKPLAMCSISVIIAVLVFCKQGGKSIKVTLGRRKRAGGEEEGDWEYTHIIEKAVEYGARVKEVGVKGVCVDGKNKILSTPASMYTGKFHQVHDGIVNMVDRLVGMTRPKKRFSRMRRVLCQEK